MVHTIFAVAIGWLALDALIVAVLLLTGSRRRASRANITALFASDPFRRLPEPRPVRLRIERRATRRAPARSLPLAAAPRSHRA
jgi:hypothetical protein